MAVPCPNDYTAENVVVLSWPEHVRRHPGMYIGDTGEAGLHQLFLDTALMGLEEARAGFCHNIHVDLLPEGGCRIADDGRGIPVDILQTVFTEHGSYPPFDDPYRLRSGVHGPGVGVVSALCQRLVAEVRREGQHWQQEHSRGAATTPLRMFGPTGTTGTTVTFWPDPLIFQQASFNGSRLEEYLRATAFLNPGLRLRLTDQRTVPVHQMTFHSRGLTDFVAWLAEENPSAPVHPTILQGSVDMPEGRASFACQ